MDSGAWLAEDNDEVGSGARTEAEAEAAWCSSVSDERGDPELPARGRIPEFMYPHVGILASFGLLRPSSAGIWGIEQLRGGGHA
jgi:hypothetical protein